MMHYDFDGNPISFEEWARIFEDPERVLRQQWVGDYWISTVWLGLDHGFGRTEKPLIFETMVFKKADQPADDPDEDPQYRYRERAPGEWLDTEGVDQIRHATKEDALNWHERWVAQAYALSAATEGIEDAELIDGEGGEA